MWKKSSFERLITDVGQRSLNVLSHNFDMLREKGIPSSWAIFEHIQYIFNLPFTCYLDEKGVQDTNFDIIIRIFVAVSNLTSKSWPHINDEIVEIISNLCGIFNNLVTLTKLCCYTFILIYINHHFYNSPGFFLSFCANQEGHYNVSFLQFSIND